MKALAKYMIPNAGTLVVVGLLFLAQSVGAIPSVAPAHPLAQAQPLISYQGTLTDQSGLPINGTTTMAFSLYDAPTAGNLLWGPETQTVQVSNGLFHVLLGSMDPILSSSLVSDLYLEIKVNGETLAPREALVSALVDQLVVSGDRTVMMEGNLKVGDNSWTPEYAGMDGNDMAVSGTIEQRGSGGTRVYKLGIGTDPGTGEGTLKMGSTLNMNENDIANLDGIRLPFKLDNERPWRFATFGSGSGTRTALQSTVDNKNFDFRTQDGTIIMSIWAANSSGGSLNMNGHSVTNCGALTEANLQTKEELTAERIDRFEEGDVLCWGIDRLEKCTLANDRLVQAVADTDGRPIVIGAERVKVVGPVRHGDILVASDVPGYAMVNNDPISGSVIAQALEDFDGGQGIIKAMIRKW